jgi:arylsulfatase A-like enzyme
MTCSKEQSQQKQTKQHLMKKIKSFFYFMLALFIFGCQSKVKIKEKDHKITSQPNIVFVIADQLRSHELSSYGGVNIQTPNLDRLADEGVRMTNAVSTYPICSPFRGMLITGLYSLHSGISNNDHPLNPDLPSFAKACKEVGYNTAFIGKWHLDGIGRTSYIPPERRLGYDYWQALECTHDYFNSPYYDNNSKELEFWEGYDAEAQTKSAQSYIEKRDKEKPFFLTLSWGPPHDPYIAPDEYRDKIIAENLVLRKNITEHEIVDELQNNPRFKIPDKFVKSFSGLQKLAKDKQMIKERYAGYLASILALDDYFGNLMKTLQKEGILDNTIVVFTSDHGDHLGSHQFYGKNTPFSESISIPFLLRYPKALKAKTVSDALLSPIDMLPTVLGLANLKHSKVDGIDLSNVIKKEQDDTRDAILLMNLTHFNGTSLINGLDTYRGVQTKQFTYARYEDKSPWLLYDNLKDPYQMNNLVGNLSYSKLMKRLDIKLDELLKQAGDPEKTKLIYDRIIKENPKRQLLLDLRNANPNKF